VHENEATELLGLGPERMELWIGQILSVDVCPDRAAAQAELPHAFLELLRGEVGMLKGDGREPDEAVRLRRAQLRELLVLELDHGLGQVAFGLVPSGVDAERRHVDALLVHDAKPFFAHDERLRRNLHSHQGHRLGDGDVRVHVDRFHPLAAHQHLAPDRLAGLRVGGTEQAAADERDPVLDQLPAAVHARSCQEADDEAVAVGHLHQRQGLGVHRPRSRR
jgi:hypothetical protein